jgi:hypothetical protein
MSDSIFVELLNKELDTLLNTANSNNNLSYEQLDKGYSLIMLGANPNHTNKSGDTIMHLIAKNTDVALFEQCSKLFEQCFKKGCAINLLNSCNNTPINWAAESGNLAIVKFCLDNGVNVNEKTVGNTLLHRICENSHTNKKFNDVLELLIDYNVDALIKFPSNNLYASQLAVRNMTCNQPFLTRLQEYTNKQLAIQIQQERELKEQQEKEKELKEQQEKELNEQVERYRLEYNNKFKKCLKELHIRINIEETKKNVINQLKQQQLNQVNIVEQIDIKEQTKPEEDIIEIKEINERQITENELIEKLCSHKINLIKINNFIRNNIINSGSTIRSNIILHMKMVYNSMKVDEQLNEQFERICVHILNSNIIHLNDELISFLISFCDNIQFLGALFLERISI